MSKTYAYLPLQQKILYAQKAKDMGMSEGELTQKLIKLYLNLETNTNQSNQTNCIQCRYYQMATSKLMGAAEALSRIFSFVEPEWKREKP